MKQISSEFTAGHQLIVLPGTSHHFLQDGNPALPAWSRVGGLCVGRRDSQFQILHSPWGTKTRTKTSSPGEKPGHPESLCRAPCLCWGPNHVSYHLPLPPPCSRPVSWPVHQLGVLTRARLAHCPSLAEFLHSSARCSSTSRTLGLVEMQIPGCPSSDLGFLGSGRARS